MIPRRRLCANTWIEPIHVRECASSDAQSVTRGVCMSSPTIPSYRPTDRAAPLGGALSRVSWGAVFAGLVMATALQITLTVLGAAIGLTALDGEDSGKAFGIGAAIWALLVPLITLFVGGMTVGRLATVRDSLESFMHGALVWALSLLLATWLIGTGASRVLGGTLNLAGNLTGSAVTAAGQVASRPDLDASDVQGAGERARSEAAERGM